MRRAVKRTAEWVKRETVLTVALVLAVCSMGAVPPDRGYAGYIDFRTLGILFGLMTVMAGLKEAGVFRAVAWGLLGKVKSRGAILWILVMLCFFFSMGITNDVALITFVPFAFILLRLLGEESERRLLVPVVVLQTVAANLGSMLTPIGNPQNLYLYGKAGCTASQFVRLMFPYTGLAFVLLSGCCLWLGRRERGGLPGTEGLEGTGEQGGTGQFGLEGTKEQGETGPAEHFDRKGQRRRLAGYGLLFCLCLLAVARWVPWQVAAGAAAVFAALWDRPILKQVDYGLLLTFVGFFVFIGNMGRVPVFRDFLQEAVEGREVAVSVLASQVISNVPAALLLSGFTSRVEGLILGTNLGGLGTLIASMASLISYKHIARERSGERVRYLLTFTGVNLVFLGAQLLLWRLLA